MKQRKLSSPTEDLARRAGSQPRQMWAEDSPESCWAAASHLTLLWQEKEEAAAEIEKEIRQLEKVRAWERIPPEQPYGSMDALLKACVGVGEVEVKKTIARLVEETPALRSVGAPEGNQNATKEEGEDNVDTINIESGKGGTSSTYRIARLKRDAPAIADALAAGKYPTVAAAYRAAGLERKPDPVAQALRLVSRLSPEDRARFVAALRPILGGEA